MTTTTNRQWLLASRPRGEALASNFRLVEAAVPHRSELAEGQVLVQHHYLSLDPYLRGRMDDAKSYAKVQGQPIFAEELETEILRVMDEHE